MRGHITKRGDSWTAIVDLPADPATGKRRQKRVTARTKRDVEHQVAALIQAGQTGFTAAGKLTVRGYFDRWLATTAPTLRPVTVRRFRDLTERVDVPTIRFHDLRHTSATLLLAEGVHGKIVQERLGHANIAMTLDLYSHVTADMQRQAADTLEAAIAGVDQRSA